MRCPKGLLLDPIGWDERGVCELATSGFGWKQANEKFESRMTKVMREELARSEEA